MVGGETAGIPFAAWMADRLALPMQYVRKKPKGFGRNAQIEGHLEPGQRVLLVEDLTTDGRSKVNFCNALREAGATVEHIFVVFFYGIYPESKKILADLDITLHHLCTWWDVLEFAKTSANSIRSSWTKSRNSSTIRRAGRRRMAASRRPPSRRRSPRWSSTIRSRSRCRRKGLAGADGYPPHRALHAGRELTEVVDDKTYRGKIGVRLGPVALTFAGTIEFEEIDNANHRARVQGAGYRRQGPRRGAGDRDVRARADGGGTKCWCTPISRCRAPWRNTAAASA